MLAGIGRLDNAYIAGGNVKRYNHSGKQFGSFLKQTTITTTTKTHLNLQLPYDPGTSFQGIYPRQMKTMFVQNP